MLVHQSVADAGAVDRAAFGRNRGPLAKLQEDLLTGALSIVWDLDDRASILGEVQVRDDAMDPEDDYALRAHGGLAYKVNKRLSLMGYVGSSSGLYEDYYGMGRAVVSF